MQKVSFYEKISRNDLQSTSSLKYDTLSFYNKNKTLYKPYIIKKNTGSLFNYRC